MGASSQLECRKVIKLFNLLNVNRKLSLKQASMLLKKNELEKLTKDEMQPF